MKIILCKSLIKSNIIRKTLYIIIKFIIENLSGLESVHDAIAKLEQKYRNA